MSTFSDLVLFRCAELVPGDAPLYDAGMVAVEGRLAAAELLSRLGAETLLSPAGQGLVAAADPATLPALATAADDLTAPVALRGRIVVGLPDDFGRLVRVRLAGWTASLPGALASGSGLDPYPSDPAFGPGVASRATVAAPEAFLRVHAFAVTDFPGWQDAPVLTEPGTGAGSALRLRTALVAGPVGEAAGLSAVTTPDAARAAVKEILYLPAEPDPEALKGTLRDAVAWATASRLLGQDAEARALSGDADARAARALQSLPVRSASVHIRRGLLL